VEDVDDSLDLVEIAQFKQEIYHKVFCVIFHVLEMPSVMGEVVICSDLIKGVLFPGYFIQAIDGEDACGTWGMRGAKAYYLCPHCLVPKHALSLFSPKFRQHTQEEMIQIYKRANSVSTGTA